MSEPRNLRAVGDRIEQLLDEVGATAPPRVYERAEELLRLVTDLYGAGLERVIELIDDPEILARLVDDDLVASLLLVHGLHPDGIERRIERALDGVRPFLARHDGDVELVDIDATAGAVLIRLLGSCDGCPSSSITLQHAVERAILEAAPEIATIDVAAASLAGHQVPVTMGRKPTFEACPAEVTGG